MNFYWWGSRDYALTAVSVAVENVPGVFFGLRWNELLSMGKQELRADGGERGFCLSRCF